MKFTLICDESGTNDRYLVVGALTIPRTNHAILAKELLELKRSLGFHDYGEIKWGKVSQTYLERYQKLLSWFFEKLKANNFRFRAHVVDTSARIYRQYGEGDLERSFYKIYYHLLFQSVRRLALDEDGSSVLILLDDKRNRYPFQLPTLKRTLNLNLLRALKIKKLVANVEPRHSSGERVEPFIQIVDILIGAIGYVRNAHIQKPDASPARIEMIKFLQEKAGTSFALDTTVRAAFNLWTFDVKIAMQRRENYKKKNRPIS